MYAKINRKLLSDILEVQKTVDKNLVSALIKYSETRVLVTYSVEVQVLLFTLNVIYTSHYFLFQILFNVIYTSYYFQCYLFLLFFNVIYNSQHC